MGGRDRAKVLVAEPIGEPGLALLRERCEVVFEPQGSLGEEIADCEGLVVRSATTVDRELLEGAPRLRVVGRAGVGVDNIDIEAATERGVVVVNAPQSNVVTAAEHTMALLLALARNVPQAHSSLVEGRWERSRLSGIELEGKTLGVLGFGRIGQLVARRAHGFGMRVVAFDPFVAGDRFAELAVTRAEQPAELFAAADFITLHLPSTGDTEGFLDADAFAAMRPGTRVVNVARGPLIDEAALVAALDSGHLGGAAIDVFREEPVTEHPLFGRSNVVVTPHLGASTGEATARAGEQTAEQVIAVLVGGAVLHAVNAPALSPESAETVAPYGSLAEQLGALAMALAGGSAVDEIRTLCAGRLASEETRILHLAATAGALRATSERPVNAVNAALIAAERGIATSHQLLTAAGDLREELSVVVVSGGEEHEVSGALTGPGRAAQITSVAGQRFAIPIERYVTVFRYGDAPGMLGRIGGAFGEQGVNIVAAAVGAGAPQGEGRGATGIVTTDRPVSEAMIEDILRQDGFVEAHTVALW